MYSLYEKRSIFFFPNFQGCEILESNTPHFQPFSLSDSVVEVKKYHQV